jgi:hypothetical protein
MTSGGSSPIFFFNITALDKNQYIAAVLMDLSKAFDCLPHNILLDKLSAYGVSPHSVALLKSYLSKTTNKSQQCSEWLG